MYLCAELENKPPAKVKLSRTFGGKRPSFFKFPRRSRHDKCHFILKHRRPRRLPRFSLHVSIHCSMNDLLQLFILPKRPSKNCVRGWQRRPTASSASLPESASSPGGGMPFGAPAHGREGQHGDGARRTRPVDRCAQSTDALGLGLLVRIGESHAVSVTAATECEVWTVNKEALFDFMLQHPEAMRRFVAEVSDRTQFLSRRLRQLTLQSLRSRVLDFLHERGRMESVQTAAQQLGVQRPSLSRVLSDLAAEGRVENETGVSWPWSSRATNCEPAPRQRLPRKQTQCAERCTARPQNTPRGWRYPTLALRQTSEHRTSNAPLPREVRGRFVYVRRHRTRILRCAPNEDRRIRRPMGRTLPIRRCQRP